MGFAVKATDIKNYSVCLWLTDSSYFLLKTKFWGRNEAVGLNRY